MVEPLSLLTALLLGLFGASHCLVMCGGIAAAVGSQSSQQQKPLISALAFHSGRISSYTLAGLTVGFLGLWLSQQHQWLMLGLRTLAGIMLMLMGLYVARWATWLTRIEAMGQGLWRKLQPRAGRYMAGTQLSDKFLLGMLWGWLPCGLIYSALSWVAANGEPLLGAAAMASFGLGTLPMMLTSSLAGASLIRFLSQNWVRQLSGVLLLAYGLWTLVSVWHPLLFNEA